MFVVGGGCDYSYLESKDTSPRDDDILADDDEALAFPSCEAEPVVGLGRPATEESECLSPCPGKCSSWYNGA